eukprot:TRINITY_DN12939_c1_g1_i1.p1 TRINITY_DN12939_c1_g1~~TRINITY_DN12939_c1_g1_i1.p1  ORF type:complete len:300 (-),score=66.64 TRINITY_DN12939_c1_g1_i1:765-1664(-)
MSTTQQQTNSTQSSPLSQLSTPKRKSLPRRNNSGILKKPVTLSNSNNTGIDAAAAALPVKRRGSVSYQQLKRSMSGGESGDLGDNEDLSDVGSVTSSGEEVQMLESPEYKETHWEQFGTAQILLLSVSVDEELLSFYDQALSAEGYDVLIIEDVIELGGILQKQKVEPDLLLFLCNTFMADEAEVVKTLRELRGSLPVYVLSSGECDRGLAMQHAVGYLDKVDPDDIDELVTNINVQLKRRHEAKLQVENMIEHAQKMLAHASFKRSILFTLAEEEGEEELDNAMDSKLLAHRQQVQQV